MLDNKLINSLNNTLGFKKIKIKTIDKVDDYLFIVLDNGQKILTNGNELYNVSEYSHLSSVFNMGDKFCAVFTKVYSTCVVNLKTMEILYEDINVYHVSKQDERTLYVIMGVGGGNNTIYDIETKKYLPSPTEYEFERSLGNNLYVFREAPNYDINFYEYKRCIINANGQILLKNIEGWVCLSGNHLIIIKKNEISIIGINGESILEMKTIKQNEKIIAKPTYYDGNIIIIERGTIKTYTPNFELINEIKIEDLEEIIDYEIVADTLKLCLPLIVDKKQINKHLYVNLKTGKSISHIRIEGYPYWTPTTYIGQDSVDLETKDYHFYNDNFDQIISVSANSYENVDSNKECMFVIRTKNGMEEKKQLLNAETGSIRDVDYGYIKFHLSLPYGYGVNFSNKTIDFFDENLNIIIPGFDYKKFDLSFGNYGFSYFIVNNYVCIINHFVDGYGLSRYRHIIQNSAGDIVLNSIEHKCYAMGNLIQIIGHDVTQFLNTVTGEIGVLSLTAPVDEKGNINFNEINDVNNLLTVGNNDQFLLPPAGDGAMSKVKKIKSKAEKDASKL